jgi:hypothetical protein
MCTAAYSPTYILTYSAQLHTYTVHCTKNNVQYEQKAQLRNNKTPDHTEIEIFMKKPTTISKHFPLDG